MKWADLLCAVVGHRYHQRSAALSQSTESFVSFSRTCVRCGAVERLTQADLASIRAMVNRYMSRE